MIFHNKGNAALNFSAGMAVCLCELHIKKCDKEITSGLHSFYSFSKLFYDCIPY